MAYKLNLLTLISTVEVEKEKQQHIKIKILMKRSKKVSKE